MKDKTIVQHKRNKRTDTQVLLAQYFTPTAIAEYMSSMFNDAKSKDVNVLDAGAGEGILGLTLIKRLQARATSINATFVELDELTFIALEENIKEAGQGVDISLINNDFIDVAFELEKDDSRFSHIILNPPYFKLRVDSRSSQCLKLHGVQVTNIYAAFVWLSARLLKDDGQLIAIIPRSFCNGPYFLKFRRFLVNNFSIDAIHIFNSRNKAFARDKVLQENIIIHISKRKQVSEVKITYSTDQSFADTNVRQVPFEMIITPNDASKTIYIPAQNQTLSLTDHLSGKIQDLEITASTGPTVDFRCKNNILASAIKDSVPLLYPAHMSGHEIDWPLSAFSKIGQHYKPQTDNTSTLPLDGVNAVSIDKNVLPLDGHYVVVRRFSSKEEKRRIFASVVSPEMFNTQEISFENHLNYFHSKKHGFDKDLAYGLCAYLNSSILDDHFRKVSGHTQVNVSDLKRLPYPNKVQLRKIGAIMQNIDGLVDDIVTKEILGTVE